MATDRPRFVCDTNVLVSAVLFPRSVPGQALALARRLGVLLASRELAEEIRAVLSRAKFNRYVTAQIRDEFLAAFVAEAEFVEIVDRVDAWTRAGTRKTTRCWKWRRMGMPPAS